MVDLKDLQCLAALARHRHFARAATECGLSQPAFSMRIRGLEDRLETQIVRRGNKFQGLTEDGEKLLGHARHVLDRMRALEQDMRAPGEITGSLALGTIPTALAYAAQAALWLNAAHPGITLRIETTNSLALQQGIEGGTYDAGITYAEGTSRDLMTVEPLYEERYVLLCPRAVAPRLTGAVSWVEAAALPLSLLEPRMQNRRILDRIFADAGAVPRPLAETSGFTAAIAIAVQGGAATVLPSVLAETLGRLQDTVVLPLRDPEISTAICLVTPLRQPQIPAVQALRRTLAAQGGR